MNIKVDIKFVSLLLKICFYMIFGWNINQVKGKHCISFEKCNSILKVFVFLFLFSSVTQCSIMVC